MSAIHLRVMKLKGDGQSIPEELFSVFSPYDERIVKNTAVHAHGAIQLRIDNGGGSDDHAARGEVSVLCGFGGPGGILQVIPVELIPVVGIKKEDVSTSS